MVFCKQHIEYSLSSLRTYYLNNSAIYVADDFYSNPEQVIDILQSNQPTVHHYVPNSKNGVEYDDLRHEIKCSFISQLTMDISHIHGQVPITTTDLYSNMWKSYKEIPYKTHYYYPHRDEGYTAIIYLNDYGCEYPGTNLYEPNCDISEHLLHHQHIKPWRSKDNWNLIYTIPAKYNRLVLFNGNLFWHGMSVFDSRWTDHYRMNQVIFYSQ
jgi:hypothetical protein